MALPTSKRQAALNDLIDRLGYIQTANGYNTDAGLHIYLGEEPPGGPDDPAAQLVIAVGDDTPETVGGLTLSVVPFEIRAIVPVRLSSPLMAAEALIADIKEAVEGVEAKASVTRALGQVIGGALVGTTPKGLQRGVTRALRREEGSEFAGASVEYLCTFEEPWGPAE